MKVGDLVKHKHVKYLRCGIVSSVMENNYCYVIWTVKPVIEVNLMLETLNESR